MGRSVWGDVVNTSFYLLLCPWLSITTRTWQPLDRLMLLAIGKGTASTSLVGSGPSLF